MAEWQEIGKKAEVKEGIKQLFKIAGQDVVITMVNGNYYAFQSRCPHLGGKLAEGKLEGTVVTCPLHGSQFDITDGRVIRWTNLSGFAAKVGQAIKPARPLKTYPTKVQGDTIMVEM